MFKKCKENQAFIIAEVGQNHQGNLDLAKKYIQEFARLGADAVKFQTRNNKYLFSEEAYNKKYDSENAFASSYGAHREALEIQADQIEFLKNECHKCGVKFMSTPFDEPSLDLLADIGVDILKVASFDLGNLPFIKKIASKGIPTVISVGGGQADQIKASVDMLLDEVDEVAVLHCVSEYPCTHDRLGLNNIDLLKNEFPKAIVGLSDHFKGIVSGPVAFMKGARVFEKHVTLDRTWKGTDHSFALMPHGFSNFVRDIKRVPEMMHPKPSEELGQEYVFKKLGKSLIAAENIIEGEVFTLENLSGKIFSETYIPVRNSNKVIGRRASASIAKGDPILWDSIL